MKNKYISFQKLINCINSQSGCLLIGASAAGRRAYKEIKKCFGEGAIQYWTDKKYNLYIRCGLPVSDPNIILKEKVKMILIAGKESELFAGYIIEKMSLEELQTYVITDVPANLEDFVYPNIKYTDEPIDENELLYIDPLNLINESRLDIVIKYIACKEILSGQPGIGMNMYELLSMSMNDGEEFIRPFATSAYFSAYESKKGFESFKSSFIKLIKSMQKNGFMMQHFIPLSESAGVINGTHRLATAIALEQKVYAKKYIGFGEPFLKFEISDLAGRGYSAEQIDIIMQNYKILCKKRKENEI